jgi:hypothetical protein
MHSQRLGLAMVLICALTSEVVRADWRPEQQSEFTSSCVQSCRDSPNVRSAHKPKCAAYCQCVLQEGQRRYSAADYEVLNRLAAEDPNSELLKPFAAFYPICSRRVLGG